jgi:hypothetical protein
MWTSAKISRSSASFVAGWQRCPISAGNIAALHCLLPRRAHLLRSFRLVEPIDRDAVPAIERLVQQLCTVVALAGDHHPARVQIVLRGGGRFLASELDQDLPELGHR